MPETDVKRLYLKFRTESRFYVYDAASNHVLGVSQEVWESIDRYLDTRSLNDGRCGAESSWAPDRVSIEIEEGLGRGFLAEVDVKEMGFYPDPALIRTHLRRRIPHLTLELTQACNAKCHYCPYAQDTGRSSSPQRMEWSTLVNAVGEFMSHSSAAEERSVSFWGGEPLIEFPMLARTVEYLGSHYGNHRLIYQFTTNGTLLDDDVVAFLIHHDFRLLVSLDGPAEIHDRHRVDLGNCGTFDRIRRGLERIEQRDPLYYKKRVKFICVLTSGKDIAKAADFFTQDPLCGGHDVKFLPVVPPASFVELHGRFTPEDRGLIRQHMRTAVAAINESPTHPLAKAGVKNRMPIATRPRTPIGSMIAPNGCCVPLLKKMHVTTSGSIHVCERMDSDNAVGNVNTGGIDIDAATGLVQQYCDHSLGTCRTCWALRLCATCYRHSMVANRWSDNDREQRCAAYRRSVKEQLEDYAAVLEANLHAFDCLKGHTIAMPI